MNRISPRQLFFFLACVAPVGKIVLLPARLAEFAKNDLIFPAAVHFLVQALLVFCVLLLVKCGKSFYELLEDTFGKIAAKIVICLFALFLLFAALLPLLEQKLFVQSVFYDTLPSLVAFSPFFLFAAFLCAKPLAGFGRVWDVLAPIAIAGMAGVLLLSVGSADYAALLPVGAGKAGFFEALRTAASWFFDSALLLPLLGKIDYEKGIAWKGTLCYLAGAAVALFFLATFYGVFAETSVNQLFAFTKTSKYFSGITVLGRIDYLFIFALALVMAFYCAMPVQACVECVNEAFGRRPYLPTLLSVAFAAILFTLSVLLDYRFGEVLFAVTGALVWVYPVFTVLVPALSLLLRRDHAK